MINWFHCDTIVTGNYHSNVHGGSGECRLGACFAGEAHSLNDRPRYEPLTQVDTNEHEHHHLFWLFDYKASDYLRL